MRSRNGSGGRYSEHLNHSEADEVMHAAGSRAGSFTMGPGGNNGYQRFDRANAYAEDIAHGERRTLQCAGSALFTGVVLLLWGFMSMYSSDYTAVKMKAVGGYDEIVDRWTDVYSEDFSATRFDVAIGDAAVTTTQTHEITPIDHASGKVHDYYPTAFEIASLLEQIAIPNLRANETMDLPVDGWGDAAENSDSEHTTPVLTSEQEVAVFEYLSTPREVTVRAYSTPVTPADSSDDASDAESSSETFDSISLGERALVTKTERRSNGWKPCKYQHGGYFRAGMCTTYTVLDTLCVKVSKKSEQNWIANVTYGGPGCDNKRDWEIESRKMTRAPVNAGDPNLATVRHLGAGRVIIRSAFDPLIAARNITDGSMFFAEKQAGQSAAAVVLLCVGGACLVPGVVLGLPFLSRMWRGREMIRKTRSARRGTTGRNTHEEEFDDIL